MSNVLAIAQKELKSYFASPIAYIVIGFFAAALRLLLRRDAEILRQRAACRWARWAADRSRRTSTR